MGAPTAWLGNEAGKTVVYRIPRPILDRLLALRNEGMKVEHVCSALDAVKESHVTAYQQAIDNRTHGE